MTNLALLSWVALIAGSAMAQAPSGPRADGFGGPFSYDMIGSSDKAFVWVDCSTGDARAPGRIDRIRQISRVLERK